MKRILLLVLVSLTVLTNTFSQEISSQIFSSGNGSVTAVNGASVQYTIGQSIFTETLTQDNNIYITQGFEQPTYNSNPEFASAAFPDLNMSRVNVYPNPAVDYTQIEMDLIDNNGVELALSDMWGQVLKTQSYSVSSGKQVMNFQFGTLNAGVYTIKVKANQTTYAKKLIISGSRTSAAN